jgi:hypothetical protein
MCVVGMQAVSRAALNMLGGISVKQIERLLVLQGQRCFFCDSPIPGGEASVEHLIASATGGTNDDSNCVVCCRSLNAAFGNKGVKEKLRAVLNHRGPFVCPSKATRRPEPVEPSIEDPQISLVIADLHRRESTKPQREKGLRNTIATVFQHALAEEELSSLLERLQATGIVSISDGKVTYSLPAKAG